MPKNPSMKKLLVFILLGCYHISIQAKDLDGEHAVYGAGGQPCSDYINARQAGGEPGLRFIEWVFAYFSAFNVVVNNTYNIAGKHDGEQILGWLDDYCTSNQQTLFVSAVAELTQNLYPQRINISPNADNRAKWRGAK